MPKTLFELKYTQIIFKGKDTVPGRMSAGSRVSILFVAMITYKGHGTLVTTLNENYSTAFS